MRPIIDGHNDTLLAATSDRVGGDFLGNEDDILDTEPGTTPVPGDADDLDLVNPYLLYETDLRLKFTISEDDFDACLLFSRSYCERGAILRF